MTDTTHTNPTTGTPGPAVVQTVADAAGTVTSLEQGQDRIRQLLTRLEDAAPPADVHQPSPDEARFENRLAVVRLGLASSLYYALRTKHAPTAAHCLRVALSCSAWCQRMRLNEHTRDRIEVAALLHDLGKIGVPDRILRKPGRLTADEQLVMDCCPQLTTEILRGCTADDELLNTVLYFGNWYESRRDDDGPRGRDLPLGSRMLAIADAFDAMTTDTVYRAALSRERAVQELLDGSCTQFDPELALDFSRMLEEQPEILHGAVVKRWLNQLQSKQDGSLWSAQTTTIRSIPSDDGSGLFYQHLVDNIKDGVTFTDSEGTIVQWNDRMQDLTSIAATGIVGKNWSNETIRLRERDNSQQKSASLVDECLMTRASIARPMLIEQAGAEPIPVHVTVSPVQGVGGGVHGTVIVVRDMSEKANLKKQLKSLHQKSTLDALTGVANRACFDAELAKRTRIASAGRESFSLIICDIDHFKSVNDVHGHPAGDEALVSFARILSSHSRGDDLVARYGGEEFLLLAPKCDNATAANRAEAIRKTLERTGLPSLGGESVTASFGVTEYQSGDSAESVLARADRALLKAKDNGRNRVIQLGNGNCTIPVQPAAKRNWLGWFDADAATGRKEYDIIAPVPCDLAIDKLRGFIADHSAEIIEVKASQVVLKLNVRCQRGGRRRADRRIAVRAELTMSEHRGTTKDNDGRKMTNVHVILEPIRNRDRRNRELSECFSRALTGLNSYLMGQIQDSDLS